MSPVLKGNRFLGLYVVFVASEYSRTSITEVEPQIEGIHVKLDGYEAHYERRGLLRVSSTVGLEEELGDRYRELRRELEKALEKGEVQRKLEKLE